MPMSPTVEAPRGGGQGGFTLLEMLVALAVFAVAAALSYGGLRQVLAGRAQLLPRLDAELSLYRTAALLADDLQLAAPRPVRDALGSPVAALRAAPDTELLVSLTRREPALALLANQPTLVRVDWRLRGGSLWRETWPVLDTTPSTRPDAREMLTGVRTLQLQFLGLRAADGWQPFWPRQADARSAVLPALPRGATFTLTLADGRSLRRVLRMPTGS